MRGCTGTWETLTSLSWRRPRTSIAGYKSARPQIEAPETGEEAGLRAPHTRMQGSSDSTAERRETKRSGMGGKES
jgi:hypothetical protein